MLGIMGLISLKWNLVYMGIYAKMVGEIPV